MPTARPRLPTAQHPPKFPVLSCARGRVLVLSANVSSDITASAAWGKLHDHHSAVAGRHLREFFAEDPERGRELTVQVADLHIDYSKHRVTRETLDLLVELAREAGVAERRDAMFRGE